MKLRVAGAQLCVHEDVALNEAAVGRALERAAQLGADILLTPEGMLSGYTHRYDQAATDAALERVTARAAQLKIGLALGVCRTESDDEAAYNELRFYDKQGCGLGFHTKTLNTGTLEESSCGEIEHFSVRPLRTFTFEGLTIGGLICNDMWGNPECTPMDDPHLAQQLSRMGARVVFHAVNGGRNDTEHSRVVTRRYHETNVQLRARAGGLWIVVADNAAPLDLPCSVASGVVNPKGEWVVRAADVGEDVCAWMIELD